MKRLPGYLALVLVAAISVVLCNSLKGSEGLAASAVGIGLGVVLVAGSYFITHLSSCLEGTKMLVAFYGSLAWSFGLIIAAGVITGKLYPELAGSVVLPALSFYLVYRFDSVIRSCMPTIRSGSTASVSGGEVK